ncbi:MAG: HNH endonuclease [Anaerolineae bacterium]|nr:HNH endonuclease [Anaerolineae bacterium]
MQEFFGIAYDEGIGDAVRQVYIAALQHNLAFSPYRDADGMPVLGIVPRQTPINPILLRVQLKSRNNKIRIYREIRAFCDVYRLKEEEVEQALGSGWYEDSPQAITAFTEAFDALFEIVEARHGKQIAMFPVYMNGEHQEEVASSRGSYKEGARLDVIQTRYERDASARKACIDHYTPTCIICGFNFGEVYGEIGDGFTHVHHLTPLSAQDEEYDVDPVTDLRPVCPNCHAMLHRREPPYTIEELRDVMRKTASINTLHEDKR